MADPEPWNVWESVVANVHDTFAQQRSLLSFEQYLERYRQEPERQSRNAAHYLLDTVEHFGTESRPMAGGAVDRYKLFDLEFDPSPDAPRLIGQESLQASLVQSLRNFVREGRANRLLLLHGPNGSAKSTFVRCLMRGLEQYSSLEEGALYRFNWVFEKESSGSSIGFSNIARSAGGLRGVVGSDENNISLRIRGTVREHPLLLLPLAQRRALLEQIHGERKAAPPRWLWEGQASHKNQQIFQALLSAYRGDLARVLQHVEVERYVLSRFYRTGAVTIGPEMSVDASERQLTVDSLARSIPASLSTLALTEPVGELVDGLAGIIEYSDLMKRPLDAWKYLLLAVESGEVALSQSNLALNAVTIATSNELHYEAFRQHHEYRSFRGRLQAFRVRYLVHYDDEQRIYERQLRTLGPQPAPHTGFVAALWAVLTRLRRAQPSAYDDGTLGHLAQGLTPMEKAHLYAKGKIPARLDAEQARLLRGHIAKVKREGEETAEDTGAAEGEFGVSPRDVQRFLLNVASTAGDRTVTPVDVMEEIRRFCEDADHEMFEMNPDHGYHDAGGLLEQVHRQWLLRVQDELRRSASMVDEQSHEMLFERYVTHVSFWLKNERLTDPVTGQQQDPDQELMNNVEGMLDVAASQEKAENFRRELIRTVAGVAIDHPGEPVDYRTLFSQEIAKLQQVFYEQRSEKIRALAEDILQFLQQDEQTRAEGTAGSPSTELDTAGQQQVEQTTQRLFRDFGYTPHSLRIALSQIIDRPNQGG